MILMSSALMFSSSRESNAVLPNLQEDQIEYLDLQTLNFEYVELKQDEEIELLSFSGGKNCDDKFSVFKQFIGIRKLNGDTVRILAECQTLTSRKLSKTGVYSNRTFPYPLERNKNERQKVVAFNRKNTTLEKRTYPTCIGGIGFPLNKKEERKYFKELKRMENF